MVFHKPVNPYVFNVRTAYQLEAATLIDLLKTSGMQRISILYVDDGFGKDVLEGLKTGLSNAKLQATAIVPFDRTLNSKDSIDIMKPSMTEALKGDPQIVIVVGAGLAVKNSLLAIRSSGSLATLATLSNNASTAFIKLLSPHGRGVIVSQVFPDEKSLTSPFVREAQQTAFKAKVSLTPGMMEGYAAAKVLVQGLRGAGSSPTRDSLVKALDSMKAFDLGDLVISYSPTDHTGLEMTDLSMITKEKGFQR
jgi:ABC-type branched-subunit amino acid transport system substrate-binding protein